MPSALIFAPPHRDVPRPPANCYMEVFIAQLERWALRRPLWFAVLMTAFLFAIVFAIFTPAYQTNDDVVMSMIASGNGVGLAPDEHIIFSHVSIGFMLKTLYTWAPDVSWYAIYLFAVQFLAQASLLYAMLTWRYTLRHVQLFYLCFATVGIHLLVTLQFTSVAFFAVESGAIVALTAVCRRADDPTLRPWRMLAVGVGLMVLGSMVRLDSYYAAAAIVVPPAAFIGWRVSRGATAGAQVWRPAIAAAILTQVLVSGLSYVHLKYYEADAGWREFLEFNPLRVKFNDYQWIQYTRETRSVFDRVKWSENDHAMIDKFYFDDPNVFSVENLRTITTGFPWVKARANWRNIGHWWSQILHDNSLWPIWLLLPVYVWFARNRRWALQVIGVATLAIVGMLFCLMWLKMPPARVYYPMFSFQLLVALLGIRGGTADKRSNTTSSLWLHVHLGRPRTDRPQEAATGWGFTCPLMSVMGAGAVILAAIGAIFGDYRIYRYSREAMKTNQSVKEAFAEIAPKDDELFVCWGSCFPFEAILPLDSPRVLGNTRMLILGWTQQSPVNRAMKERFHIADLARDLYANPKLFLVSSDDLNAYYSTFAREHQQVELDWESCFDSRHFSLWKPTAAATLGASAPTVPEDKTATVSNHRPRPVD